MASSVAQSSPSCFQDPSVTDGTSEPPTNTPREVSTKREFDFIELPPRDFFCPVSFDLLLEPQQTKCCGHHLSLEVTTRLQREGKACPMCKSEEWSADLDKYHRRKVHQVRVRCWYKESGCAWEGDMNGFKRHSGSCEKRPWECEYCGLKCTYGEGEGKHWGVCDKFPEPCPNGCEVGSVERCVMEQHRSVCPLEPVACEMREFGCSVVVPRREMVTHMKESEIQHLTSMTALNLRLTKQLQHDSAKMEQMITEQRKDMEEQKKEMAALLEAQKKTKEEMQTQKGELTTYVQKVEHSITNHMQYTASGMHVVLDIPGTFSTDKPLYSEPFYSYHGYKFQLGVVIIPLRFYGKSHTLADFRRQQLEFKRSAIQSVENYHEMGKEFKMEEDKEVQRQLQEIQEKYQLAKEKRIRLWGYVDKLNTFLDEQREKMKKEKDEVERKNWYIVYYAHDDGDSKYCWQVRKLREKKRELDSLLVNLEIDRPQLIEVGYDVLEEPALYDLRLEGKWEVGENNSRSYITKNMIGTVFHLMNGEYDQQLSWPVKVNVQLELLNQTGDHCHLMKTKNLTFTKEKGSEDDAPLFKFNTKECLIMQDRSVVYFLNSCLKFRMIICMHIE